jgi:hypothetical protein
LVHAKSARSFRLYVIVHQQPAGSLRPSAGFAKVLFHPLDPLAH